jgi:hypothetical protein
MSKLNEQEKLAVHQALVLLSNIIDQNVKGISRAYLKFMLQNIASYLVIDEKGF